MEQHAHLDMFRFSLPKLLGVQLQEQPIEKKSWIYWKIVVKVKHS